MNGGSTTIHRKSQALGKETIPLMGRERAAGHAITRQEEEIIGGYGAPAGGAVESLPIDRDLSLLFGG
jgi:hypothetical protein